jgi:hypothetical protein
VLTRFAPLARWFDFARRPRDRPLPRTGERALQIKQAVGDADSLGHDQERRQDMFRLTRGGGRARRGARAGARRMLVAAGASAAVLVGVPLGALQATGTGGGSPARQAGSACPQEARPLPADALAGATRAALREAPSLYGGPRGIDTRGRRATRAALAQVAGARGGQVRRECGRRVQRRTVVVDLEFPRMLPSASLSQGTVFISRLGRRYQVWEVAH